MQECAVYADGSAKMCEPDCGGKGWFLYEVEETEVCVQRCPKGYTENNKYCERATNTQLTVGLGVGVPVVVVVAVLVALVVYFAKKAEKEQAARNESK